MQLSKQEIIIINMLREAVPFEVIEIHKDKLGFHDTYLIHRSQKIMISPSKTESVKSKMRKTNLH